jgi:serine phosphatase RsbU (regulator of sigma subunit)
VAQSAAPSLRRLIHADAALLLDDMTAALPGLGLAIVDMDGTVARSSGDWPGGAPEIIANEDESGDGADARRWLPLEPRGDRLGSLVAVGEAPDALLRGLQRSLSLLLGELLDKHDLARETLERYREINLLYRAAETVGAALNAADVPRLVLLELERVIPAPVAMVLVGEPAEGAHQRVVESRGSPDDVAGLARQAGGLMDKVASTGRPDIAVWPPGEGGPPGSAVCVPIRAGERVLGLVVLGRGGEAPVFSAGDEKLLLGLAGQAGVALERARLHERETRRQRLEEELNVARRIQLSLLPARPPTIAGWSFAASYQAARQVGGDFYDFLDTAVGSQRRLGLVVADVTGKGVPAALMMAYSRAVLRAESTSGRSPTEVLARTNELIMKDRQTRLFLSAFYAELDLDSGRMVYASAGHDAPLWVAAGATDCRQLDAPGVILGAFHEIGLEARTVDLAPGDSVILYTDGVTEARNHDGQLFGDDRLVGAATMARGRAGEIMASIADAIAGFTAGAPQADDLTIMVVQRDDEG